MRSLAELQCKREGKAAERQRLAHHKRRVSPEMYSMDRDNHAIAQRKRQERRDAKRRRMENVSGGGTD